ncbi:amino acid permease [Paenibacillus sp. Marseille-Q4541]|uniref:amino acid permease n=1 Tax=Paenibacillus sp. Marseille-Q4541 TaxID=2831522 RepID=UPI001BAA9AF0|nr:amino acid permease [Paenibacillus sp. Marseille-Q4541]
MGNNKIHNITSQNKGDLKWWQLSLLGVACTIGTGYFLGSALAIQVGGPSVLLTFLLAALGTYCVFNALASMTAASPEQGSFRSYAKQAYGRWAGFSSGWGYFSSELLIMGSQLTALSLFTRLWFPGIPMWVFAAGYALLGLIVIMIGNKLFDPLESAAAIIKIAAIFMFIALGAAGLFGWLSGGIKPNAPLSIQALFPSGITGAWSALLFSFYAYGGVEVMGLMAVRLKQPQEAPKAGRIMIILLAVIYIVSLFLVVTIAPWQSYGTKESPFVQALATYKLPFIPHLFNGVLIVAGFSTMVASLYAVTTMLVTLAQDKDAPPLFARKVKERFPIYAYGLNAVLLIISIVTALLVPETIYEYITTAAGLMLLYNWSFILVTSGKLLQMTTFGKVKKYTGLTLILLAVTGTLFHKASRPGFWISFLFIACIGIVTLYMQKKVWKSGGNKRVKPDRKLIQNLKLNRHRFPGTVKKIKP